MSFVTMNKINDVKLGLNKSAKQIVMESAVPPCETKYDIFLSHSYRDYNFIAKVKTYLEKYGHSVYVDWIEDKKLDRSEVSKITADTLKSRMDHCKCLFYVCTPNAADSKWMPWELGYFDGKKGKVAIFPIVNSPSDFDGQEYLGLYPNVDEAAMNNGGKEQYLWINYSVNNSELFTGWI